MNISFKDAKAHNATQNYTYNFKYSSKLVLTG